MFVVLLEFICAITDTVFKMSEGKINIFLIITKIFSLVLNLSTILLMGCKFVADAANIEEFQLG